MSVLRCHPDCHVRFDSIRPAGFRILAALDRIARHWIRDLWLTSGTDGTHSGPTDPHKTGEAYDVRSKDCASMEEKIKLVRLIVLELCEHPDEGVFVAGPTGFANVHFFAFVEAVGTGNEHIHVQRRKGLIYP